ncbi:efflux RND transporter periplasmic adaptor subunit [Parvularcula sp. IMCC14364]|uniref:efflux RND transporter periplasmic adaptor subunit n=1 Tax=Parvularcula sp. IMCC14364 TaxID=3067902 RepID=UPI0027420AE3|nr:efflux RND transporter periplasmic adaptor subunit [Parvularcula sp. IMCC14364]
MRGFLKTLQRVTLWSLSFVVIVAMAALMGTGILSLNAGEDTETASPLPVAVETAKIQDRYSASRRFPGRIEAAQVSDVAFQVAGEVADVSARIGDRVTAGQALAQLDPVRLRNRQRELQAALDEAAASLTRAEATISRIEGLVGDGYATEQSLDDITAERNALRARARQLEQSLATARQDLNDAVLRAPFDGVVVQRYVDSGATVNSGQPIVRINASGKLDALIGIPASFAARMRIGDTHTLEAATLFADAELTGIGDAINSSTQTVTARFEITEDPGFVPGGLVRLKLDEERLATGIWVPATALNESYRGLWSVYIVIDNENDDQIIARKDVEIIHIGDSRVFVTGTLEEGDRVVTAAPFRFVPGQRVTIVETATTLPGAS